MALAAGGDAALLERHAPVLAYDRRERHRATRVAALRGGGFAGDVAYGRVAHDRDDGSTWLQYWLFSVYNGQDRGVVRTGRHEGDWELVQIGLDARGRPARVTAAQHSWAEACAWQEVRRRGVRPVVFVAHASHASYLRPGDVDRPFPDPTDEAPGDGPRVVPRVLELDGQAFAADPRPFGASRASWVPGEQSSPVGPRFQDSGAYARPAAFHRGARECGSGAPGRPAVTAALVAVPLLGIAVIALRRRLKTPR